MGPEGIILVNPSITTFQQSLTHSAMTLVIVIKLPSSPRGCPLSGCQKKLQKNVQLESETKGAEHGLILMNHHTELDWIYSWMV